MIATNFLKPEERQELLKLARSGKVEHRLGRRANALLLLDGGMSCEQVSEVLFIDDDTVRTWHKIYQENGVDGLSKFHHVGSECRLNTEQQEELRTWVSETLPQTTRQVGEWIEQKFGVVYEGRTGVVSLLHRLGMEYRKPQVIPRRLDEAKQQEFINKYNALLTNLPSNEVIMFADAVHPTHAVRPSGCWAPKNAQIAVEQNSGRDRLNIHGAINLENGDTQMLDVLTVNAESTIKLLTAIENKYPKMHKVHVFLDNARYHHANIVQEWLKRPECRIELHFIPAYCPHLDPIERLWGVMHKNVTHNKCYPSFANFCNAILTFLREKVPHNWRSFTDSVTDNFRVISPLDFRVIS